MTHKIIETSSVKEMTYNEYVALVNHLVTKKMTTGKEQTESRIHFTKLNASRMRRLDKTLSVSRHAIQTFQNISEKQTWFVLLESWCADGAQTIPVLNKIVEEVTTIDLKILLRDENPELMDHFLTNGTRSIPKLIIADTNNTIVNTWGPRSREATNLVEVYKKQNGKIDDAFKKLLQVWYNRDMGGAIIEDLVKLIEKPMAFSNA